MATFLERVTALSGVPSSSSEVTTWLRDATMDIVRRIKILDPVALERFATGGTIGTSGITMGSIVELLDVNIGSFYAKEIPAYMRWKAGLSTSLYRATTRNPVYYKLRNRLYALPSSASAYASYISPYTVSQGDSSIANFPNDLYHLVALYAAMCNIHAMMSDLAFPSDVDLPTPPTIGTFSELTETLPTYTAISRLTLPAAPAGADINFSEVGSIPVFVEPPNMSMPTLTLGADLSISSLTISSIPPVLGVVDLTAGALGSFGTAPEFSYIKPVDDFYPTGMPVVTTHLDTNEDIELAQTKIQQVLAAIQEYQTNIQSELGKFTGLNVGYQASVQKAIEEARNQLTSESKELEAKLMEYQQKMSQYQIDVNAEIQEYLQTVNSEVTNWATKRSNLVEQYRIDTEAELQEYTVLLQNNSKEFDAEAQVWLTQVRKSLDTYQAETGYDVALYRAQIEAVVAEARSNAESEVSQFNANLSKYGQDLSHVNEHNQRILATYVGDINKYQADAALAIQNFNSKLQKRQIQHTLLADQWMKLKQQYEDGFVPYRTAKSAGST